MDDKLTEVEKTMAKSARANRFPIWIAILVIADIALIVSGII